MYPLQKGKSHEKLVIKVTDHWGDLLLIGTETPSCQKIEGNVHYNKCLLAYEMDGKIQAIVIADENEKIIARSIVKLLYDEIADQWALFQERLYASDSDSELPQLIRQGCIQYAKHLGIPLLFSAKDFKEDAKLYPRYPNCIKSLDCPAPYEYVDSLSGIQSRSYTISDAHSINV